MEIVVDVSRIAEEFGISKRQVQRCVARGLPRDDRGQYNLFKAYRWFTEEAKRELEAARAKAGGLEFERMRATRAQADALEHNLRERRAALIPREVAETHAKELFDWVRQTVLADLPALAAQLARKSRHEVKQLLHRRNGAVLARLATGEGMPPVRGAAETGRGARAGKTSRPRRGRSKAAHTRKTN